METWQDLERDIKTYLLKYKAEQYGRSVGLTGRMIEDVLKQIKSAAWETVRIGSDEEVLQDAVVLRYLADLELPHGSEFYYRISWRFAPSRYHDAVAFVKRYEAIVDAEMRFQEAVEATIADEIDEQTGVWDEYSYDDQGEPGIAIFLYADRIEVKAFESGWGDRLPRKGRKYIGCQGDIRWRFPLSALESLPQGYPVINVAKIEAEKTSGRA